MRECDTPAIPFAVHRLVFEVVAEDELILPAFAGSALRGAYGRALRRLVCMTGAPSCDGCSLRRSCPFPRLFEPAPQDIATVGLPLGAMTLAPPFALEPPDIGRRTIAAGESWRFGMRLYGTAWRDLALVVEAMRRALITGLTMRRARGRLIRVLSDTAEGWRDIYDERSQTLDITERPRGASVLSPSGSNLLLGLLTPLRIQSNGQRLNPNHLTAKRLAADILRRMRLLAVVCADDTGRRMAATWPVEAWLRDLDEAVVDLDLRWFDWERMSSRQGRTIRTGGWLGRMTVRGAGPAGAIILSIGTRIGLGKECVFGFGQYEIEVA